MKPYRVTGWNPETQQEFNLGIFLASDRNDAIRQARKAHPDANNLVLDAAEINSNRSNE